MGEDALYAGRRIKIGTCEDMYYLRADQRFKVDPLPGNVHPGRDGWLRFRFPFPDEDGIEPGQFGDPFRSLPLSGVEVPNGVEHGKVQFKADPPGYLVSLPCPEGPFRPTDYRVHRNGFAGSVRIVQQRVIDGQAVLICQCAGCKVSYRLPTREDALPYIEACEKKAHRAADNGNSTSAGFWFEVAARISSGYTRGRY